MKTINYLLSSLALFGVFITTPSFAAEPEFEIPASEELIADLIIADNPALSIRVDEGKDCSNPLALTDAQLEKMAALKDQFQLSTAAKKAELRSLRRQMMDQLTQPTIDRQKITGIHDKMASLKADLSNARLAFAMDRADVLTAEQRKEIHHKMLLRQAGGRKHWRHHGCGQRGFGGHHRGGHGPGPAAGADAGAGAGAGAGATRGV